MLIFIVVNFQHNHRKDWDISPIHLSFISFIFSI